MGVFKKGKDGKYVIQFQHKGVTHTCYSPDDTKVGFERRADAVAYEPIFRAKILAAGKKVTPMVVNDAFISDFMAWMRKKLKPSTFYGYVSVFDKYWKGKVVGLNVADIDNNLIEAIADKLFRRKANHNGKSAVGKLFVKYLKKYNVGLDPDIIQAPKKTSPHVKEYSIYTKDDFERFFAAIDDESDQFLFLMLFHYGLRISECLGLMWTDFKPDGLHIDRCACVKNEKRGVVFTSPKTVNSIRVYPLLKVLAPYLEELRPTKGGSPYVFPAKSSLKGALVEGQSTVRRKAIDYAEKAGLEPIKLHEFRHSCVSNLLASGLPVRVVARWVGDTERMVQDTYSHLLPSEKDIIKDFFDGDDINKGDSED